MRSDSSYEPAPTPENNRAATLSVLAFPLFILVGAAIAFVAPAPFLPLADYITYFLMIIMFAMGLTLTVPDFKEVLRRPIPIIVGVILQFGIMPLGAVLVIKLMNLPPEIAIGLLMLGCVPGGTSSNVVSFLARGDVALSVTMTSVSTILSPIVTPLLMLWLSGEGVDVDAGSMAWSLVQTVLAPVILGLLIRTYFSTFVDKISFLLTPIAILGIGGVVFPTVANNKEALATVGMTIFVAVLLHNLIGYILGYIIPKLLRFPESQARTISVEVSTQSAGLAAAMSGKYFQPESALPGAVAAVLHNITGAIFAAIMRRVPLESKE
jgi:bile acid:Na+ symporter, BASS family